MKWLTKYLDRKYAPKWLILQIDLLITVFSIFLAYLLRFNFEFDLSDYEYFPVAVIIYLVSRLASFKLFKTYSGIVRYTSTDDAKRIFLAIAASSGLVLSINVTYWLISSQFIVPLSIFLIDAFTSLLLMTSFRVLVKIIYARSQENEQPTKTRVLIYGAGRSGLITKRTIDHDGENNFKVVAFCDDDDDKNGKTLEGVEILAPNRKLISLLRNSGVDLVIISIQDLSADRKREIIELCLRYNVKVKSVPPANKWINGELSLHQIKDVRIEDLLERDPIDLDRTQIAREVSGKKVLISGACGSIGSELVRQIINFGPKHLILFDQSESPMNDLQLELREKFNFHAFTTIIGSVRDLKRIQDVFLNHNPQIVFHVAAYKHVPLMEDHPSESILTNVSGTRNMADSAITYGVDKFVMISTDKAVNPTNVMGASKRIAEIYTQSLDNLIKEKGDGKGTRFITTRFGNVLGSNGSVIPRFRKQIQEGGPVTVTHPEISRYFMTIPEACQLILEAGAMGNGGEIFIFDMGRSVKIVDLAYKMIKLSGLSPNKDVEIKFTGLRSGEKIYEELLNNKETTMPTHHDKIMIGKVRKYDYQDIESKISKLIELSSNKEDHEVVRQMKRLVPEFLSQNSIYESLDKEGSKAEQAEA